MDMDPQILVELTKIISEQNKNPVRIEKNLVQQNLAKDKTWFWTVQLGSKDLIIHRPKNSQFSEAQQQQIFEQLCQMEQQKKLYNQLVTEEPLGGSKSAISEDTLNRIRAGDLGKSGPGPRAKADARAAANKRSTNAGKSGTGLFVNSFTPNPIRHRFTGRLQEPLQGQNRPDRSKSQISDVTIQVETEEVRFETPENLSDRVQDVNEAKRIGKLKKDMNFTKKQIYRKYKHRFEYSNPDGSPIANKREFRQAQIRLVQNSDTYVSKAIHISKDHDPQDCYLFIDDVTRQVVQANPNGDSLNYLSTRTFSKTEYEQFKRHGVIGEDWDRLKDVSFMRHGMSARDVINHMNNNPGEL